MTLKGKILAGAVLLSAFALAHGAFAQQKPDFMRIRGTVVSLEGSSLTVKTRQGSDVTVKLADDAKLIGVTKASVSDIKPGVFIGTASLPKEGSASHALEVVVFPDAMRGFGEGDYAWDLEPGSMMTNGTIAAAVESMSGPTITVAYKGGERTISVASDTPVVTFGAADKSDIKPDTKVFTSATKQPDGSWKAGFLAVGKDGVTPPM
jgi:hypothetical protein